MHIFKSAARQIYEDARREKRLIEGRTLEELKRIALRQDGVIQTQLGSVAADSEPMNRSAPHTRNSVDHPFGEPEEALARQAVEALGRERVISLDTLVGDGLDGVTARFLIPETYARIPRTRSSILPMSTLKPTRRRNCWIRTSRSASSWGTSGAIR